MDDRNGEVFDHHAELFAQIGGDPDHEAFKDFMLEPGGPLPEGAGPSHDTLWNQYHESGSLDLPLSEENTSALIDSLVMKHLPADNMADTFRRNHVLDNLHKSDADELLDKLGHMTWNGAVCHTTNLPPCTIPNRLQTMDKNGNSNKGEHQIHQNHFITRLSPSASVESNVHTPTTSYESVSPLSSNRTPIRSDESISPMGSGHTPLRMEESASPLAAGKTPVPSPSPLGPPSAVKMKSPVKPDELLSPKPDPEPTMDVALKSEEEPFSLPKTDASVKQEPSTQQGTDDAAMKKRSAKKILIPFVSATRIDEVAGLCSVKRTVRRTSSPRSERSEATCGAEATSCDTSRLEAPEADAEPAADNSAQINSDPSAADPKPRKRRQKTDSLCVPSAKRRCRQKQVTIYQSSVSPEEGGIKLKIKLAPVRAPRPPRKKRRSRHYVSDDEEEASSSKRPKKSVRFSGGGATGVVEESGCQSDWATKMPPELLQRVFQLVVDDVGCVPSLVRFSSVCKLWNSVAIKPELWQNIDLSSRYIKQKYKIDRYFRWLLENRLGSIQDLNLSGWKFTNITMILSLVGAHCSDIESIGLAGWQGLQCEHLRSLLQDCPRLSRLDLSDVSPESKTANSAVSPKSIMYLTQTMAEKLTSLILAHNTLTCLPQIISSLAMHCPNLQVLDLCNVRRVSHTEFALNIEHLQEGCPKLRVLRITNSCVTLANVPLEAQAASPGFQNLEELSIAGHQGTESLRITSVMDDDCLERILKTSHKLKLLDVRGCTRITDSSLVRVSAWDIEHLFLSGCFVTRQSGSGLELIAQKWAHSLVEVDLAWTTVTEDLNAALLAFAEKGDESPLRILNLCGSSVTLDPVKAILTKCPHLESLNLQSCRGLPRGVKRLYEQDQLLELRAQLDKSANRTRTESGTEDAGHTPQHDST